MTKIILLCLIALVLFLMSRTTEKFGYAGHTKPVNTVVLDDPGPDMSEYNPDDKISITNDMMEKFVIAANEYVSEKTGLCTYVIETTSVKKFRHKTKNHDLYKCMFMFVRQGGFSFGFSVTVDIMVVSKNIRIVGARTQPIDVKPPSVTTPFESNIEGKEFVEFSTFEKGELDLIKNKSV